MTSRRFHNALLILSVGMMLLGQSCTKEIRFKQDVTPHIIVNSLLNPDSLLVVDLWWSRNIDEGNDFRRVENASVTITENGIPILESVSSNEPVCFDYYPKENTEYGITVSYEGYADVCAHTFVPARPRVQWTFDYLSEAGVWRRYRHYDIEEASLPEGAEAAYLLVIRQFVTPLEIAYSKEPQTCRIWSETYFADTFNRTTENEDAVATGSTNRYFPVLRVARENADRAFPLHLAVEEGSIWLESDPEGSYYVYESNFAWFIAAGYDYDRYYKSLYLYDINANADNPLAFEVYPIYSNIENGIGIFAGYSAAENYFAFD